MNFCDTQELVDGALRDRCFPGIALWIGDDRGEEWTSYSGVTDPEMGRVVNESTLFDMASLTKPLATGLMALKAIGAGSLDLEAPVSAFFPQSPVGRGGATIRDLMRHSSGLPAVPALHRLFPDPATADRDRAKAALLALELEYAPGSAVLYSCAGFLVLGLILEQIGGMRLGELFDAEVATPLGISPHGSHSGPLAGFAPFPGLVESAAPTEFCPWRDRRIVGEVHDESAWCLGGDGGNAGLFANLQGAKLLFREYEGRGVILGEKMAAAAREAFQISGGRRRGLALQLHDDQTCDGPLWGEKAYGHTGFTGGSAWRSPTLGLYCVALTNRVYYGRDETAEAIAAFRLALHGAVATA